MPLLSANPDEPFLLEIRYTVKGDGSSLDLPAFVEDAAVQQVYLCVYLPADKALLGATGPWTAESPDAPRPAMSQFWPGGGDYGNALVAWVREGTKAGEVGNSPRRARCTSTPPCGRPRRRMARCTRSPGMKLGLSVIVFLVAVALGVILLPATIGRRCAGRRRRDHPPGARRRFLPHLLPANLQRRACLGRRRRTGPLDRGVCGLAASRASGAMARCGRAVRRSAPGSEGRGGRSSYGGHRRGAAGGTARRAAEARRRGRADPCVAHRQAEAFRSCCWPPLC